MARLKNRQQSPPGGFVVDVPATGYHHVVWGFDQASRDLHQHLLSNPGIHARFPHLPRSIADCEIYVDTTNAARCLAIPGGHTYVLQGEPSAPMPPKSSAAPSSPGAVRRAGGGSGGGQGPRFLGRMAAAATRSVQHARKSVSGAQLMADWLGAGLQTVGSALAEQRAAVCAAGGQGGKPCPLNAEGDFWQKLDAVAASEVRRLVEIKNRMQVATTRDAELKTCQACDCHLPLKVHVPLKHILDNLSAQDRPKLTPFCWILSESKS